MKTFMKLIETIRMVSACWVYPSYLAEKGVLSVELALSVLSRPPGVEVFLGTPEPKPMGLGRSVLLPDRMLEVLLTPDPRRPSSDSLRLMLEPYLLPGLEPWAEARLS